MEAMYRNSCERKPQIRPKYNNTARHKHYEAQHGKRNSAYFSQFLARVIQCSEIHSELQKHCEFKMI